MNKGLSTEPYKGVRDFYPEDMAVQRYIFDVWAETAASFGYERYDASVLEPAELYKAKGAENEEMVNEQTYTFTDRGEREVTLRPEMTPTVARMIAGRQKQLSFPVRWYSIPNLFRYERSQKGRVREHWQLNCDIFGSDDVSADIEAISLAYQVMLNFGADPSMFEVRFNDRAEMNAFYESLGVKDADTVSAITRLNDRFHKVSREEYQSELAKIVGQEKLASAIYEKISQPDDSGENKVLAGLRELGISNIKVDRSLSRGFDYYTGTIFEIFDTSPENARSIAGGGRYDNLTSLFGGERVAAVGFAIGDVTMRGFLETHNLLTASVTAPDLVIMPLSGAEVPAALRLAQQFRAADIATEVDFSDRKVGKKLSNAGLRMVTYALVLGEEEVKSEKLTLKNLESGEETSGTLVELTERLSKF